MKAKVKAKKALKVILKRLADDGLPAKEATRLAQVVGVLHYVATAKAA